MRLRQPFIIFILFLFLSSTAYSQEAAAPLQETAGATPGQVSQKKEAGPFDREGWHFVAAPYVWLMGMNLKIAKQGTPGAAASVDYPWYDALADTVHKVFGGKAMMASFMIRTEFGKARWGFFLDYIFLYSGEKASLPGSQGTVKTIIRQGSLDAGMRYLLGTLPLRAEKTFPFLSWELLGGLRYIYVNMDTRISINAPNASINLPFNLNVVEPMLGLRTGVWFTEKINLLIRTDMGGFGIVAYDRFDATLEALVGYKLKENIRSYVGYRGGYASFNMGANRIKMNNWFHGPVLGTSILF